MSDFDEAMDDAIRAEVEGDGGVGELLAARRNEDGYLERRDRQVAQVRPALDALAEQNRDLYDPKAILDEAHAALETFRGYLAGMGDESRREAVRSRMFEPLSRAVGLLHIYEHTGTELPIPSCLHHSTYQPSASPNNDEEPHHDNRN